MNVTETFFFISFIGTLVYAVFVARIKNQYLMLLTSFFFSLIFILDSMSFERLVSMESNVGNNLGRVLGIVVAIVAGILISIALKEIREQTKEKDH
jgi:D-alanyl-lipoteichoic acid acyltransferase DltB (MBOAT superfamily)